MNSNLLLLLVGIVVTIFVTLPIIIFLIVSIILSPVGLGMAYLNYIVLKKLYLKYEHTSNSKEIR